MAGRGLGIGPVGPELGEHAGVVAERHDLRRVGLAGSGVDRVAGAVRVAVVEGGVVVDGLRQGGMLPMPDGAMSISTPSSGESAADQRATSAKPHL